MWDNKPMSKLESSVLDRLGYSLPMVRYRREMEAKLTVSSSSKYWFKARSKVEGTTKPLENDNDIFAAPLNVLATTAASKCRHARNISILELDMRETAPGYTRLTCFRLEDRRPKILIKSLLEPIEDYVYLSSDTWREECRKINFERRIPNVLFSRQSHGPSNPRLDVVGETDEVCGIVCDCPEILQRWIDLKGDYCWPPIGVIKDIARSEAHVVPIGYKDSPYQFLEWRICFTKAEIKLIHSLNEHQLKLLILLKMVVNDCLKPVCKDLTSYTVKNIVMWMAEKLPGAYFTESNLLLTLYTSLEVLRRCLMDDNLPSYMIPERNLLGGKLSKKDRLKVSYIIRTLLNEGPGMLTRCGKLENAFNFLYKSPAGFRVVSERQLRAEIVFQWLCHLRSNQGGKTKEGNSDKVVRIFSEILRGIVLEDLPDLHTRQADQIYYQRLQRYLS